MVGSGGSSVVIVVFSGVVIVGDPFSSSTVQENSTDSGEGSLNWVELVWIKTTS